MLSKINAQNFMSWKDLTFTVTPGATLVDGWNNDDKTSEGSGKSAILNAISWCIFGKIPKDANVDEVIKDGESSCSVILDFDNGDQIIRTRKPNELYLVKSEVVIKGKDSKETQSFIEEYIGCNFETFCQSVYFAQNYDKKFLAANQAEKGKILSSIQNLQVFDKARKETMSLLKLENDKITKLRSSIQLEDSNLSSLQSQKSLVESFIKDKIQKHEAQVSMMTQQKDLVSGHIKRTMSDIEAVNQKVLVINLEALSKDEEELNQVKIQYSTQLSGINYQISQVDSVKKAILAKEAEGQSVANRYKNTEAKLKGLKPTESSQYKNLSSRRDLAADLDKNQSRARLILKAKQLADYVKNPTKVCPSCGTELKTVDASHTTKELSQVLSEIEEIEAMAALLVADLEKQMNDEVKNVYEQSVELSNELVQLANQLQTVSEYLDQNKIPSLDDLLSQATELKSVISQIDAGLFQTQQQKMEHSKLLNQHSNLLRQLGEYEDQYTRFEQSITQLGYPDVSGDEAKLQELDQKLVHANDAKIELTQLMAAAVKYSDQLETLKDGFVEIKSFVFANALNELNFRTNQYLNDLFEMEASIKFSNENQEIQSKIVLDGKERGLGLLSGGQNRRFNLAVDLALADIVSYRKTSKLDLLIFDEYFKDLSEISMEKSLELLKSRKSPVILIEHNSLFKTIVDNTFFVRLEDGTSFESRA